VRISVEDGAILKGGIEVKNSEKKNQNQSHAKASEAPKAMAATAGA
jgi:hypothetical protein